MLTVNHLTKKFGDVPAVNGISFRLEAGSIYGFLGPNGAGKTTTIKILTLASKPTSGEILFRDTSILADPIPFKRSFGYVSATPFLYDHLTGREFLNFVADMRGLPLTERTAIDHYLDLFELTADSGRLISGYSSGMRKKVSIIAALMHRPDLLFLDEPTTNLDAISVKHLRDLLLARKREGAAIFLTTHILEIAEKLSDRILIIGKGRIVAEGSVEEIRSLSTSGNRDFEETFLALTGSGE
jgi:ABC-2 type transport system ATP-binding protein